MISYQTRSHTLATIADHMHRDDRVGALARARIGFSRAAHQFLRSCGCLLRGRAEDPKEAVTGVRRMSTCSMRRASGDGGTQRDRP